MPLFPISFCINAGKIVSAPPDKTKYFATVTPLDRRTYIFNTEESYYADYQSALFGITTEKGGWDCIRHYEILANGCIPLFINLKKCPENTMTHFPKALVLSTNELYNAYISIPLPTPEQKRIFEATCMEYIGALLAHTRTYLTDTVMSTYVLDKSGKSSARSILYLSGDCSPDYMRDLILAGFKNKMGEACHDHPRIDHIYTDFTNSANVYGKGFSYTKIIDPNLRNAAMSETVVDDIRSHKYDIVIYGSYHRGIPFWDLVSEFYAKEDIILICGEDRHICSQKKYAVEHSVFVREQYPDIFQA